MTDTNNRTTKTKGAGGKGAGNGNCKPTNTCSEQQNTRTSHETVETFKNLNITLERLIQGYLDAELTGEKYGEEAAAEARQFLLAAELFQEEKNARFLSEVVDALAILKEQ